MKTPPKIELPPVYYNYLKQLKSSFHGEDDIVRCNMLYYINRQGWGHGFDTPNMYHALKPSGNVFPENLFAWEVKHLLTEAVIYGYTVRPSRDEQSILHGDTVKLTQSGEKRYTYLASYKGMAYLLDEETDEIKRVSEGLVYATEAVSV